MKIKLNINTIKTECLAGATVTLAMIPEVIAFAFVAHLNPLVALYSAFFVGLITSLVGGRPGMISGAAGALAVVMASLVLEHGVEYLFAAVILMGGMQVLVGLLRLGRLVSIIPHSVILGFINGLAIVIFLSQLEHFKIHDSSGSMQWMQGYQLHLMAALTILTILIIHLLPKILKSVPSPLVAILVTSGIAYFFDMNTLTVGHMASIGGGLPQFHIPTPPLTWDTLTIILPYSFILTGVGLIESLLTLSLVDEMTETQGATNQECVAQGAANIVTGFFGGMGGCAMIGQTMININSGGRHRLSGIASACFLLGAILFGSNTIEQIPLAALVGVMLMMAIDTFAWSSLRIMNKIPTADAIIIIMVSILTVVSNLATAVLIGVIVSALIYAWKSAKHITATTAETETGEKTYYLHGSLFFGAITSFRTLFNAKTDPERIVLNFQYCRIWDHSALEALDRLSQTYKERNKTIHFERLSSECATILERSGVSVRSDNEHDPRYELVISHSHTAYPHTAELNTNAMHSTTHSTTMG
ncbi:Putative sulfate transporter YbaR [Chlamydiales bacterium SCGC AG-110-P3]|nr:Putative sulfate transporter YbaR [Chlamydiales bacterium SCGC AG-110-P3]